MTTQTYCVSVLQLSKPAMSRATAFRSIVAETAAGGEARRPNRQTSDACLSAALRDEQIGAPQDGPARLPWPHRPVY